MLHSLRLQAQLQAELAAYNIHTQAVDRYIVTQSRQAVHVGDAVGLVKHLELLTGTSDYEAQIQQQGQLLEQLAEQIDRSQQEVGRWVRSRRLLNIDAAACRCTVLPEHALLTVC